MRSFLMRILPLAALVWVSFLLGGCIPVTPGPLAITGEAPTPATAPPTATPAPPATQEAPPPAPDASALAAQLAADWGLAPESEMRVVVKPLDAPDRAPLFAAFTIGFRQIDPFVNHRFSLHRPDGDGWRALGLVELECPDFLDEFSYEQTPLEPSSVWVAVQGGTGAHSGCFDLLRWDGQHLRIALSGFNSSPGAGAVTDVDGDGQLDVLLNDTDPYIFCYACGVRRYSARIFRWDGAGLVQATLTRLPQGAPADLKSLNDQAVDLAEASLLADAWERIQQAAAQAPDDPTIYWNGVWIRHHLENRRALAAESPFPLLNHVFAGDWEAAFDAFWDIGLPTILSDEPIPQDSVAYGFEEVVGQLLVTYGEGALALQPDRAAIHALTGWGRFLLDSMDPRAAEAFVTASLLAPDDLRMGALAASVGGVQRGVTPDETVERIRFAPGATSAILEVDLQPHQETTYVLGILQDQTLTVRLLSGQAQILVMGPQGDLLAPGPDGGYRIPETGDYQLRLVGQGPVELEIEIPPR